ncbi:MAG: sodium:calcium antiporter, partial [Clostridia bacterium]|nr:sodium:calcium antiporter [Clostridia bacterium]
MWAVLKTPVLLFAFGLILLIKGGDWFVDGASGIAKRFHLPELLIGATVVSIGTTLPEVMVSATGAVQGAGAMAYGNAVGSVICNTALIAAVTVTVRPSETDSKSLLVPVAFFFSSAVLFAVSTYFLGYFHRWMGIVRLAVFVGYIVLSSFQAKRAATLLKPEDKPDSAPENPGENEKPKGKWGLVKEIAFLVAGAAIIALGANLLVDNGTQIAEILGLPQSVIALTFVALGTSLPELVTA